MRICFVRMRFVRICFVRIFFVRRFAGAVREVELIPGRGGVTVLERVRVKRAEAATIHHCQCKTPRC